MENIWKFHYLKYTEKVWMPSLHQVFISMSVHPGTPFFPNQLSSVGTKQQMPSLSSFFLPPLFLIMSVCHANSQAHALLLLLSHLSSWEWLERDDKWNCTSRVSFVRGATRRAFPICSLAPRMFDTHLVVCHQTWGSITVLWQKQKKTQKNPPKYTCT